MQDKQRFRTRWVAVFLAALFANLAWAVDPGQPNPPAVPSQGYGYYSPCGGYGPGMMHGGDWGYGPAMMNDGGWGYGPGMLVGNGWGYGPGMIADPDANR